MIKSSSAMEAVEESLGEARKTFSSGKTRSVEWRKKQLRALIELIHDNEEKIFKALHDDLGKHPTEAYRDEVYYSSKSQIFSLFLPPLNLT